MGKWWKIMIFLCCKCAVQTRNICSPRNEPARCKCSDTDVDRFNSTKSIQLNGRDDCCIIWNGWWRLALMSCTFVHKIREVLSELWNRETFPLPEDIIFSLKICLGWRSRHNGETVKRCGSLESITLKCYVLIALLMKAVTF